MSDWENEDDIQAPVIPTKGKWDDEDASDDDVKDEWDASESESEKEQKPAPPPPKPKKTLAEKIAERNAEAEKKKQAMMAKQAANKAPEDETEEERFERRQREKNAIIESDIANAADLFGGAKISGNAAPSSSSSSTTTTTTTTTTATAAAATAGGSASKIESMMPKTKDEFAEYTQELVAVIKKHERQGLYVSFLEGLMRELAVGVSRDTDVRKFASTLTTIANEKQKAAKEASKTKKKGGAAKPSLAAASAKTSNLVDTRNYDDAYDEFDDFM
ncbi:Translation initiation factor 3 subunit J component [Actinomortierella ambigua]|nr:Translation initiation factor 3 subunit J component [Actinomortierella ambigua]